MAQVFVTQGTATVEQIVSIVAIMADVKAQAVAFFSQERTRCIQIRYREHLASVGALLGPRHDRHLGKSGCVPLRVDEIKLQLPDYALQLGPDGALQGHVVERLAGPAVDGTRVELTNGTEIYLGDVVETSANGSVVIAFVDQTTFALSEDARMVIDELVYDAGSSANVVSLSLVQGLYCPGFRRHLQDR